VETDGNLVTGQNPASSQAAVDRTLAGLRAGEP
jgi:putative intracellular protease/amidase